MKEDLHLGIIAGFLVIDDSDGFSYKKLKRNPFNRQYFMKFLPLFEKAFQGLKIMRFIYCIKNLGRTIDFEKMMLKKSINDFVEIDEATKRKRQEEGRVYGTAGWVSGISSFRRGRVKTNLMRWAQMSIVNILKRSRRVKKYKTTVGLRCNL